MAKAKFSNRSPVDLTGAKDFFDDRKVDVAADLAAEDERRATAKRKLLFICGISLVCLLICAAAGLLVGNPQWGRAFYITQLVVKGPVDRPADHGGVWLDWYKSGQLRSEMIYADGVPQGEFCFWYANGNPRLQGKIVGTMEKADTASKQTPYLYDGRLTGWHENGQKHFERSYTDRLIAGKSFVWTKDGSLREFREFDAGVPHGKHQAWDEAGEQQLVDEIFAHGKLHGRSIRWEDAAKTITDYRNGTMHGRVRSYDENGKLVKEFWYRNGEPSGPFDLSKEESPKTTTPGGTPSQG